MKKEFIPYELALKLRDLGFKEECFGYYVGKDKTVFLLDNVVTKTDFNLTSKITFRAPLWQQAFKWIMTEKGYYVLIATYRDKSKGSALTVHDGEGNIVYNDKGIETYLEAMEIALKWMLKNID